MSVRRFLPRALQLTNHHKNPLEELIVLWITRALNEIFEEMAMSTFLKCIKNMIFSASFGKQHPLFSASFFFS